jgi:restriction system protein
MDGLEVLQHLRQSGNDAPVLFLTYHDEPPTQQRILKGVELGVVEHLMKPFGVEELEQSVETALRYRVANSAPPFSFGVIIKVERTVPDGQIITLVDPFYTHLIDAIKKNSEIIYQIEPRVWEEIIAAAYDKAGFDEVILTPRSGDYGRDVIAIKKGFGSVKFIEQVKAYSPGHVVKADEVRALLGVLQADQDASKAVFTTTSTFAPRIERDKFIKPFLPYRLELIDKERLLERLIRHG